MNAQQAAQSAYQSAGTTTQPPRGTEYQVIARVTHKIKDAAEKGRVGFPALAEALHQNQKLWTLLAADVADRQNGLPREIRARIFYLAEFTRDHTRKVLNGADSVAPLLEVNAAILRGLRANGGKT